MRKNINIIKLKIDDIPNILTLIRLIIVFPIIYLLEIKALNLVWLLIVIGGITDFFDGYFAEKFKLKSKFGAILDPVTDKIFIIIPLIWLSVNNKIPFWSISIIIFREFIISALRDTKKDGLPAIKIAKYSHPKGYQQMTSFWHRFYCILGGKFGAPNTKKS